MALVTNLLLVAFLSLIISGACADFTGSDNLDPKPSIEKQKLEKPKSDIPDGQKLKPTVEKPKDELYKTTGVEGLVYCQLGAKLLPLPGVVTRVTCCTINKNGYESAPFSILSKPSDKKGYFLTTLPISEQESKSKIYNCKAYLDSSPLKSCNVPTDINKGSTGALPFSSFKILKNKKMKLYHVGPFVYASKKPSVKADGH